MTPTCTKPDHDGGGLVCGRPLPCPYHTVVLDVSRRPPTVAIPTSFYVDDWDQDKLIEMADALVAKEKPND